mgnify:CR=1 FL=1
MYDFSKSDIQYICRDNPMLGLYITNDKDIVGLFTKVVDSSFDKLNSIKFNFEDFESKNLSFDHVVKSSIFLKSMNDFPKVNEVYAQYFSGIYPARETVEVSRLPKDALVEISVICVKPE